MDALKFEEWFSANNNLVVKPIVPYDSSSDFLLLMDFTDSNTSLTGEMVADTDLFSTYVNNSLQKTGARYGIGGYNEHRTVYSRSNVFDGVAENVEPRRIHLGIDIWGEAGTAVYAPLKGIVHSFAFNNQFGDYGATIILQHSMAGVVFYSLYGHLSLADISNLQEGDTIEAGTEFAHFGVPEENGYWPPHLHFQVMLDMEGKKGDYPGVCSLKDRDKYLRNCPDPDILINMMRYARSNLNA